MKTAVLIGTFDPLHGGHIGQALRAHRVVSFQKLYVCVDKNPAHKPNASHWEHRVRMAQLTLAAFAMPFACEVVAVEDSWARELADVDYKITGIDSLADNLGDSARNGLAQQWPMIVMSIPGVPESMLTDALQRLPPKTRQKIAYTYADESTVPMMNYDFSTKAFVSERIHSTMVRSNGRASHIPETTQEYIRTNNLYK
jgi:cytidyltransferase-like protein